ncbi:MAG: flavin reductase family protein [Clostridia bacterium]|nr:flavin reductase family protein [Clostridia bacterium]
METQELKLHALVAPTETVIVSAFVSEGKADACTLAFYMVSSHVPPCVTVAINATARRKTLKSILESRAFVLGIPGEELLAETDYLGVASGYQADKLQKAGLTWREARTVHAPVINEIRLSLECEVVHTVTVGSHMQVTGEVKNIVADTAILDEKDKVVLERLKPLIYDEEQLRYLGLGEKLGDAFKTGQAFMHTH